MSFHDNIRVTGKVSIIVTDKDGNIKKSLNKKNLVVSSGKNHIASRVAGVFTGIGAPISHIGFGTATNIPVVIDTDLGSLLGARMPISSLSYPSNTNTILVSATFTGTAGNITEAGMFNALTGNYLICRTTFGVIPVLATDALAITWTLTIN